MSKVSTDRWWNVLLAGLLIWLLFFCVELPQSAPAPSGTSPQVFIQPAKGQKEMHIRSVSFSPKGTSLLIACSDDKLRVFQLPECRLVRTLQPFKGEVAGINDDEELLLETVEDHRSENPRPQIRLWNFSSGKVIRDVPLRNIENSRSVSACLSRNGRYIAFSPDNTGEVTIYRVSPWSKVTTYQDEWDWKVYDLHFLGDKYFIFYGHYDCLAVVDMETRKRVWSLCGEFEDKIGLGTIGRSLHVASQTNYAIASGGGALCLVELDSQTGKGKVKKMAYDEPSDVRIAPNGKFFVAEDERDDRVTIYNAETFQPLT